VLVAASAVILVFGRRGYRYPRLRDVVVYERAFDEEYREGEREHILGMVHGQGPIILSAEHLERGFAHARDGHNVGLHELAHVLDFEGGHADGVPTFMPWKTVGPWLEVMRLETAKIERGRSILDRYAAKNEAELFAVATEVFFERPRALQAKHPELYALLAETYGQDPAARATP
jgi:Mlc titration factor MtfA (ptsG expression regulator)